MLILTRRSKESLTIGDDITITVMAIRGNRVRIGVTVPHGVAVRREEALRKLASLPQGPEPKPQTSQSRL